MYEAKMRNILDVFLSKELYGQIRKNMVNAAEVVQLLQLQYL